MATFDTGWAQFNNLWDGRIQCFETKQDIANNKTTAVFSLQLRWTDITTTTHYDGKYSMTINGTTYSYTRSGDYSVGVSNGTIITVFSKEITITHNTDGSKSVPVSASFDMTSFGIFSINNKSITLTKIPRASSFTLNVSSATIGSTQITVNISRASSSFTHKVYYSCASNHNWQANSGNEGSTTVSWTPSLSDCNYYPNSTSGTATIKVDTYNGSTWIGTASKTLTLNVPSSVVPSISSVSVAENGGSKISGTFVKGKSKANVSISASGSYSSTISSYSTTITGLSTKSGSSFTSDTLNTPGTITFTTTVKDSRGRSASKSATITVYDYSTPTFSLSAFRANDDGTENQIGGTSISMTYDVTSYADINSNNTLTYDLYIRNVTQNAEWERKTGGTGLKSSTTNIINTSYDAPHAIDQTYEAIMEVTDIYGTYTKTVNIPMAYALIDFKAGGKGMAIGTLATLEDTFECNLFGQFNRALKTTRGTYCHQAGGTGGQSGYIKFCTITITTTYRDTPITIMVTRRRDLWPKELIIKFTNTDNKDPGLDYFYVRGAVGNFYIHKSATSTWDLYALKNETWDNVGVLDVQMSKYQFEGTEIKWHDGVQVSELPSGCIIATSYNSFLIPGSGDWFNNGTPIVGEDGGMEIGKYVDFHHAKDDGDDYSTRLLAGNGDLSINGHFLPAKNSNYNLGNTSYRWNWLNLVNQPNVSSDRTLKENISYIKNEKAKSAPTDEIVTYEDMYDFVKNDLELATYNFKGQEEQSMNFIAQDLLYNLDGTDNKIGQMIINPVAPPTEKEIEKEKARLEEGQEYNYPTLSYDMGMYISVLAGALKTALNKIDAQQVLIDNLTEEIKILKESE